MDFYKSLHGIGGSGMVDHNLNVHRPSFMSASFDMNSHPGQMEPHKRTMQPSVTGTSVIGCKYQGGVIIAADTLGSYGSMARFRDVSRCMKVNDCTLMAAAGDYADFQHLKQNIEQMVIDEKIQDDGYSLPPQAFHSYITRMMYKRRSRMNPLWNTVTIAGYKDGYPFLGSVDKIGIAFEANTVASGFGAYLSQPLLRRAQEADPMNFTYEKARKTIEDCLKVLYYRDARSYNRYEICIADADGVRIEKPQASNANWEIAKMVKGF